MEWGRKLIAVEVKFSDKPKYADTESLQLFLDEYPETVAGILVHAGNEIRMMHEKIVAIPWVVLGGV
jgi:hypothetical protein